MPPADIARNLRLHTLNLCSLFNLRFQIGLSFGNRKAAAEVERRGEVQRNAGAVSPLSDSRGGRSGATEGRSSGDARTSGVGMGGVRCEGGAAASGIGQHGAKADRGRRRVGCRGLEVRDMGRVVGLSGAGIVARRSHITPSLPLFFNSLSLTFSLSLVCMSFLPQIPENFLMSNAVFV